MERSVQTQPATRCPAPKGSGAARRHGGFLLTEALVALSLLGTGLLPLAALAPRALARWQELAGVAAATGNAAEAAELMALCWPRCAHGPTPPAQWPALQPALGDAVTSAPPQSAFPPSPFPARPRLPAPRWCAAVQQGSLACPPGPQIVMVAMAATLKPTAVPTAALKAVALWTGRQ
ncbi:hypothetical protein [Cupriavidus sp. AU9028]|uniref:hypothetical protein n=1 Tax=Cupriavidus sp. AU9028 TaxID=2871157 RepID=UPI001C96161D|nr:hypothetical protein [Cupriavidus sp. AU9028]MBY4898166.1 hypothetical protein [Cupriavidus sp. AU9028]